MPQGMLAHADDSDEAGQSSCEAIEGALTVLAVSAYLANSHNTGGSDVTGSGYCHIL